MSLRLFTNNAITTLAAGISSGATSLSCTSGGGALFPNPSGGQFFIATLVKNGAPGTFECILVSVRSTDNFTTIVRGQEGTTALAWNAGDTVALLPTEGDLSAFAQFDDIQKQLGNYGTDTGSANAYAVNLSPALTAHVVGMPIRFLAGHTSTANCTFNDGVGTGSLLLAPGVQVPAGTITTGSFYIATWDGTQFQLSFAPILSNYALTSSLSAYVLTTTLTSTLTSYLLASTAASTYLPINNGTATGTFQVPNVSPPSDSSTKAANTAFVQNALNQQIIKTGSFNCTNGTVTVNFATGFPTSCQAVHVQWEYNVPDVGWVVPGSRNANGFQYTNGNAGFCTYIAVGN